MAMQHSSTADSFTPTDYGNLVDLAVKAKSIAGQSATTVTTDKVTINFPKWVADPAVSWLAELATITATDGSTGEVVVTPKKVGGITRVSRELAGDSSPAIGDIVGGALANQVGRSLDAAYLGNTVTNGPSGLLSAAYTAVDTGASLTNLDPFISARYAAVAAGSELTSWIVRPAIAEVVSKLKTATGSNQSLIQFVEDGITIAGLPVLVSDQVDALTLFWGVPKAHVVLVLRQGTEVISSKDSGFYNDAIDIRAIARYGVGFLNAPGVVRGYDAP
ncbi:MAG: Phage capsid protein [Mycobacterium sp.]|nr:Phage capsid protein [Mycobacterium sp.]